MSFTDNFGNPKGLLGRMMLVSMEREHLPMAKWDFPQLGATLCLWECRKVAKIKAFSRFGRSVESLLLLFLGAVGVLRKTFEPALRSK